MSTPYDASHLIFDPVNWSSLEHLKTHLKHGLHAEVTLEPGDATRYKLILVPFSWGLWVIRVEGGWDPRADAQGAMSLSNDYEYHPKDFAILSNGFEHTANVFATFFHHLGLPTP